MNQTKKTLLFFLPLLCCAAVVLLAPSFTKADITSGLVGWWKFDEGSGTTAGDSSGNSNTGTLVNGPTWTAGQGLEFVNNIAENGSYVSIPFSSSLTFRNNQPITMSAWIKPLTYSVPCALDCRIVDQANAIVMRFNVTNKNLNFILPSFSSNAGVSSANNSIKINNWYHVIGMYDGADIKIYINGIQSASVQPTGTYNGDSSIWRITAQNQAQTFPGNIDDVRVYNRALSAQEVSDLYSAGLSGGDHTSPPSDTTAPSTPTSFSATAVSSSAVNLSWTASADNTSVTGYKIFRNGSQISTVTLGTTYSDTGLAAKTSYSYTISAYDAVGNTSAQSQSVSATTQSQTVSAVITDFTISGQTGSSKINENAHTISVIMPYGTLITALAPTITRTGIISPGSGVAQDFTNPVTYTITDGAGNTQPYTVTVTVHPYPEPEYLLVSGSTNPDITGIYTIDTSYNGGVYNGSTYYSRQSDSAFHIWRRASLDWEITRLPPTQSWYSDMAFSFPVVRPFVVGPYVHTFGTGSGTATVSVFDPNNTTATPVILLISTPTPSPAYPARIQITGNLSPDATGFYNASSNTYNGTVYWTREDGAYSLWNGSVGSSAWYLSAAPGNTANSWRWNYFLQAAFGEWYSNSTTGSYTGIAVPVRADPDFPTPGQYLASLSTRPVFKPGHTLPPLTKFSWPYSFEMTKEMARWGYALDFGDASQASITNLNNPRSREAQLLALVKNSPSIYKLSVNMARQYLDNAPDSVFVHDAGGNLVSPKTFSPQAPDDVLSSIASQTTSFIQQIANQAPISIILNGGERGIGVVGNVGGAWKQDPLVMAAKGSLSWFDYTSNRKLQQETYFTNGAHLASDNALYLYYGASPNYNKNINYAENWKSWSYDYKVVQSLSDIPNSETYYLNDGGWTGTNGQDALTMVLNGVGQAITLGKPLSYNWVCGGYNTNPTSSANSDLGLYAGFLKTYYMAGMIGGVAGYFGYPTGGFDVMFDKNAPPNWVQQIEVLGQVHAEFSYLEDIERNGDLLSGDGKHIWAPDQPAYEFWTGFYNTRVLARKLHGQKRWLISAWAADAIPRSVKVTIPILGTINVHAEPAGSLYDARIVGGVLLLTEIDNGSMNPTLPSGLVLPSGTPDSDGSPYTPLPPTQTPISGLCSTTFNSCAAGVFADVADTAGSYLWSCSGLNGGSAAACSMAKASSDTTKPTITLTAPLNGAKHSGTITISASAADAVISGQVGSGLAGVQFRLDGVNLGQEDTDYPYSINWDTSGSSNGSHTLDAIARDGAGNTQVSQIVTITISNQDAPVNIICTTFNYSSWSNCEPSQTQSRYILSRGPQGCSGGVADILIRDCTYTAPEKEPTNAVVVGFCGFTPDNCPSGTFSKIDNTKTNYRWKCAGANGGNTAFCSLPLNSAAVSAKLAADKAKAAANPPNTSPLVPLDGKPTSPSKGEGGNQGGTMYFPITNTSLYNRLKGKIILRVESKGEAYYISPKEKIAYYLGRPSDAFRVMREQGLGITNADLAKIQIADKGKTNSNQTFSNQQKGKILLQVENKGEAWYVNPNNGQRHFLSRPADAFNVMRKLGLGIKESDYGKMGGE